METGTGLTRVLIAVVGRKCNLFNVNYGEPTLLPNYGHLVDLVNEAVDKNCLMFVSSAGNSWLASSTIGTPGGIYSSLVGVGAYVFSTMAISAYSVVESFALHFKSWSYLVKGGESTYTLAMYNLDVTRKYLATEGGCPIFATNKIQNMIQGAMQLTREHFHQTYGKHFQNRKMHCFGPSSEFLWQQFSFFETLNLKESSVLVETCRVLIFVQESEDTVRLFAGKNYSSNHSLVAYRLNWFLNACIQAIHQNTNELEDKLLRTTEKSTASTTFLLQALPFVLDFKVSWAETIGVDLSLPECSFGMVLDIVAGTTILIPIMDSSSEEIYMVEEVAMITEKEKVLERLDSRHIHCHWTTKDASSKDGHQSYETKGLNGRSSSHPNNLRLNLGYQEMFVPSFDEAVSCYAFYLIGLWFHDDSSLQLDSFLAGVKRRKKREVQTSNFIVSHCESTSPTSSLSLETPGWNLPPSFCY
ncbi:hypothetical protein V6N12_031718 [Hibiscus sabdariffa]|uniref:Uncharacterized protein n=1 Tax=Hibiscus sabdariffa TaxID=183260 RepID=A0ABR2DVQ5_9ROSI